MAHNMANVSEPAKVGTNGTNFLTSQLQGHGHDVDPEAIQATEIARKRLQENLYAFQGSISSRSGNNANKSFRNHHSRKLTLDDLLQSNQYYENEATTNILKALEEQQQRHTHPFYQTRQHRKMPSKSSSISKFSAFDTSAILPHVSEDASKGMLEDHHAVLPHGQQKHHDDVGGGVVDHENDDPVNGGDDRHHHSGRDSDDPTPLLHSSSSHSHHNDQNHHHRRDMSVDDYLSIVTGEMLNLEQNNGRQHTSGGDDNSSWSSSQRRHHDDFTKNANRVLGIDHHNNNSNSNGREGGLQRHYTPSKRHLLTPVLEGVSETTGKAGGTKEGSPDVDDDIENQNGPTNNSATSSSTSSSVTGTTANDSSGKGDGKGGGGRKSRPRSSPTMFTDAADTIKGEMDALNSFFRPRRNMIRTYFQRLVLYIVVPFVGVAALLYYCFENPPTGILSSEDLLDEEDDKKVDNKDDEEEAEASASWWLLFCVRQVVTLSLALGVQAIVIDFFSVGTRVIPKLLGPLVTLLIVQSKGWPFVVFAWSILDFSLLYGEHPHAAHWGYWQDTISLFNEKNPGGHIVDSEWNRTVLLIAFFVPIAVAVKRLSVGLFLGRQAFSKFRSMRSSNLNPYRLLRHAIRTPRKLTSVYSCCSLLFSVTVACDSSLW